MAIEIRIGKDSWLLKEKAETGVIERIMEEPLTFVQFDPIRPNPRHIIEISGSKNDIVDFFTDISNELL